MSVVPCPVPPPAPVHGVVVFEPAVFKTIYPEFATVDNTALMFNFMLATLIVNNSCCSAVSDANVREALLNVLVAHLTALAQGAGGAAPSGIVGRIDKATEGSVSISAGYAAQISESMAYFIQTKYGALFWQLTSPFRSFRYVPPPPQCYGPGAVYPYPGWPGNWPGGRNC